VVASSALQARRGRGKHVQGAEGTDLRKESGDVPMKRSGLSGDGAVERWPGMKPYPGRKWQNRDSGHSSTL
jgi:hypothetical protein